MHALKKSLLSKKNKWYKEPDIRPRNTCSFEYISKLVPSQMRCSFKGGLLRSFSLVAQKCPKICALEPGPKCTVWLYMRRSKSFGSKLWWNGAGSNIREKIRIGFFLQSQIILGLDLTLKKSICGKKRISIFILKIVNQIMSDFDFSPYTDEFKSRYQSKVWSGFGFLSMVGCGSGYGFLVESVSSVKIQYHNINYIDF